MLRRSSVLRRKSADKAPTIVVRIPDADADADAKEPTESTDSIDPHAATAATDRKKHDVDPDDIVIIVDKIEGDVIYAIDPRRAQMFIGADDSRAPRTRARRR